MWGCEHIGITFVQDSTHNFPTGLLGRLAVLWTRKIATPSHGLAHNNGAIPHLTTSGHAYAKSPFCLYLHFFTAVSEKEHAELIQCHACHGFKDRGLGMLILAMSHESSISWLGVSFTLFFLKWKLLLLDTLNC